MTEVRDRLFEELRRLSPKVTGGLLRMRQETFRDGRVPAKYKLLAAMAISIAIRCEPCIRAYVRMAVERGITEEELLEFLNVAMTMQGCPGEEWALKAYAAYKEVIDELQPDKHAACCVQGNSRQRDSKRRGSMSAKYFRVVGAMIVSLLLGTALVEAQQTSPLRILIHMKTSLAEDDAQICAVPNVAWAAVKAGHKVTILVDASAVTSVTKGFGLFNRIFRPDSTTLDRARLPERERQSLSEQMGVPLEQVPHNYGDYFDFLKKLGVEIYGNRTMMLLYKIDPARIASAVTPVPLERMVHLFDSADRIIVY